MRLTHTGRHSTSTARRISLLVAVTALTTLVAAPAAQGHSRLEWLHDASPQKVVRKLVPSTPPNYRTDVYNLARKLAKRGPDGTVDVTTLIPALPTFLDWDGCSTTKLGIVCWGEALEPVAGGVFDVCADGRTIYQNSQTDHVYTRLYGFDHKLLFRDQSWRSPYFKLSFSPDASGRYLQDDSWYDAQITMDTPGVLGGTEILTGVLDYAVSTRGNVILADYGLIQSSPDGEFLPGFKTGRWDYADNYDVARQRICDALDGKL